MEDEDSDWWSDLQTVSSFDNGITSSITHNNSDNEIQQFCPSSLLVESLISQLCKLIENEPNHQKQLYLKICKKLHQMKLIDESYEMEEFESMRSYYQKALYHLVTAARSSVSPNDRSVVQRPSYQAVCLKGDNILEWSRYATEFEEEGFIAHGGFGQVFQARHKLDGELYAVKKIYLRYNNASGFMQSLTEVKMLAKLNHPNIVSYKAAWLEPLDSSQRNKHDFHDLSSLMIESSDSSGGIVFESSDLFDNDSAVNEEDLAIVKTTNQVADWNCTSVVGSQEWACLYIQMQLCHLTLRQWLDVRNHQLEPVSESFCLKLFKMIVQGVEFIHSQGIVHHDIKPSNIFVSRDLRQVQVGDFGLACSLMTHHNPEVSILPSHNQHRPGVGVGTKLYAAPEQLNSVCSPKSDIYSLGIVLLELIQPFQTSMERSKVIGRLKQTGQLPTDLSDAFPTAVRIIKQCIYHSPQRRPSSEDLLAILEAEDGSTSAKIIAEKDEMISRLLIEARDRIREIEDLKRRVSELSVNSPETETIRPPNFE